LVCTMLAHPPKSSAARMVGFGGFANDGGARRVPGRAGCLQAGDAPAA
jgi:hypothetical protein